MVLSTCGIHYTQQRSYKQGNTTQPCHQVHSHGPLQVGVRATRTIGIGARAPFLDTATTTTTAALHYYLTTR